MDFFKKVETEGISANGGEVAIPPQKNGLTGCGDLAFQNKMSGLGGACKSKTYFCAYCECSSADEDLLGYVSGSHALDCICAICQRNRRETCAHRNVNDMLELKKKGQLRMAHLLEDFQWRSGNEDATIIEMLPVELLDCYAGYDLNLEKVWETRSLRNIVGKNGSDLLDDYIYDYSRNILHT